MLQAALPLLASQREADTQIRLVAFVEAACAALARMHPPAAMQALPAAVDRLHQLLASPSDGVRRAASEALLAVIRACVTPELVRSANVDAARGSGAPGALARAVAALAATLQPSCSAIWHLSLPVVAEMLRALGPDGGELAKLLIAPLAALCRCVLSSFVFHERALPCCLCVSQHDVVGALTPPCFAVSRRLGSQCKVCNQQAADRPVRMQGIG